MDVRGSRSSTLVCLFCVLQVAAPRPCLSADSAPTRTLGLHRVPRNLLSAVREEIRWEGLLTIAASAAAVTGVRSTAGGRTDAEVAEDIHKSVMGPTLDHAGSWLGNGIVLLPAAGAVYFAGKHFHDAPLQEAGQMGLEALALSTIETYALKMTVRRERPDGSDRRSFPSGHAASAFSVASVAASEWGWKAGVPAVLLAGMVGLSRMDDRKHYLSDVTLGMGIGVVSGRAVWKAHHRKTPARVVVAPVLSPGGAGLVMVF